jgi:hypothetical protein
MSATVAPFTITFPPGYDARREYETPFRGYLSNVVVQLGDGARYRLYFIDPARLGQNLADNVQAQREYYTEPNLVVLPEVTTAAIHKVVQGLWQDGAFRHFQPLP